MFLIVTNAVVPKYYNRKPPIGQPLFSYFCNWVSERRQNPSCRDTPPGVSAPHRQKKDRVQMSTSLRGAQRRGDRRECLWCNLLVHRRKPHNGTGDFRLPNPLSRGEGGPRRGSGEEFGHKTERQHKRTDLLLSRSSGGGLEISGVVKLPPAFLFSQKNSPLGPFF